MTEPRWDPTITSEARIEVIRSYAQAHPYVKTFVETGSADGDTCAAVKPYFDHLHTIEIVPSVYENTKKRLDRLGNVDCYLGDSTHILPAILRKVNAPCLFWLDGHYCGSLEARGEKDTPVREELEIIFATGLPHVVLIDDARLFGNDPAYPTIEWVRQIGTSQDIQFTFTYADDIMRLVPK